MADEITIRVPTGTGAWSNLLSAALAAVPEVEIHPGDCAVAHGKYRVLRFENGGDAAVTLEVVNG